MPSKRTLEALRSVLSERQDDLRTCVLVVGDGLNLQGRGASVDRTHSWDHVLSGLWRQASGKSFRLRSTATINAREVGRAARALAGAIRAGSG